jgi:hypothetical protein
MLKDFLMPSSKKTPLPVEEVDVEVFEQDESKYKALLFHVYSNLQRIRDALNKDNELQEDI